MLDHLCSPDEMKFFFSENAWIRLNNLSSEGTPERGVFGGYIIWQRTNTQNIQRTQNRLRGACRERSRLLLFCRILKEEIKTAKKPLKEWSALLAVREMRIVTTWAEWL